MSNGAISTDPPELAAAAALASASSTANQTCQWLGTPSMCGAVAPPALASPTNSIMYSSSPIGIGRASSPTTSA